MTSSNATWSGSKSDRTRTTTLDNAFRAIHSIKGATGYLGLTKLGGLAHAGESLLSELREGRSAVTPAIASDLLQLVDFIRQMLSDVERTGSDA